MIFAVAGLAFSCCRSCFLLLQVLLEWWFFQSIECDFRFKIVSNVANSNSNHFFSQVQRQITRDLVYKPAMIMSPNDTIAFQSAVNCWVCQKPLNDDRVRDHCHVTGKCFVDCENVSFTSHTYLVVSRDGFHARWRDRKRTDVDKIRLFGNEENVRWSSSEIVWLLNLSWVCFGVRAARKKPGLAWMAAQG